MTDAHGRPQNVPSFGLRYVPQLVPVDVPWMSRFGTFEYIFFSSKKYLKTFFSLNHQFWYWSLRNHLKVPWKSPTLGPLGDPQGTFLGRCVPAGMKEIDHPPKKKLDSKSPALLGLTFK